MKRSAIFFWIFTGLLIPAVGIGSVFEIMKDPDSIKIIVGLGYPAYLSPFLGVARIMALLAICIPGFSKLKEWAYAGFTIDFIGAAASVLFNGGGFMVLFIVPFMAVLFASYALSKKVEY